ncbi:hypothetical protein C7S20_01235 [Christiangramia fulva]|uniref:DUF2892 domain-containing protein n=1 Tax=Christiangramia fulva TaxID=2126553 RepID=A0A2R3Z177_9FLAO|nr:hypothetical protein [Christiangramia fulva]AVR43995.1 hypothetical protein C7S20_01235 [Christiangramia fulva]
MKERLLKNWTWLRVIYLGLGIAVIIQSALNEQWWGILLGAYVGFMGLFSFGCASGNCQIDSEK